MLERLIKQRSQLILSQPFFGYLAMRLKLIEDLSCKTFWVDGVSMGYNPEYGATLDDLELRGCLAHEVMHPASGHCWRMGSREQALWNRACDYAANPILIAAGFRLPAGALLADRFFGLSPEEIFAVLRQEQPLQSPSGRGVDDIVNGAGAGPDGRNAVAPDGPLQYEPGEVRQRPKTDHGGTESQWKVAVLQAAQFAKMRGKFSGELQAVVDALSAPVVDWRAALMRFAQATASTDYSWSMPNRRYTHLGLYLPSLHTNAVGDAVFVRDSSGSVFDETQRQFAAEIRRVFEEVRPARLFVLDCDADVRQVQVLERGDAFELAPVRGGGGTEFSPAFEWVEREGVKPAFLTYLTDMDGGFPERVPPYPTLWASTTPLRRIQVPPFGECIEVIV
ncbi:DUF2201 family putative metallopeptidase [Ralstonia nicotianae]|uniref:vWA domain-containing protein n=1 Tax=Ralstonia pseudosolanacearum TaxID=1310165 RepID=UPI002005BB8D|nr:VWA-like domain-containing protein [Ralstonia pseudosolanacearum]MCK4120424.1 hypothetical protein [Ralstonia pseudosolanacearum]